MAEGGPIQAAATVDGAPHGPKNAQALQQLVNRNEHFRSDPSSFRSKPSFEDSTASLNQSEEINHQEMCSATSVVSWAISPVFAEIQ